MIDRDDIRYAYRFILGREPESEQVVENHFINSPDMASLRARFLAAPEFYKVNSRDLLRHFTKWEAQRKHGPVEYECPPADLKRLFDHVREVWSRLGEVEPHYSVVSQTDYKPEKLDANLARFFRSGEGEVELLKSELDGFGLKTAGWRHCVELGSGVGRVTRYLANMADSVTGYDVSQPHLDIAGRYLSGEGVENVSLVRIDDPGTLAFTPCDLFYSRIVLQHNPPPVMLFLVRKILEALTPGGVAVFQLPTFIEDYAFQVQEYLEDMAKFDDQELHMLPQKAVFRAIADAGCDVLSVYRDNSLSQITQVSNRFVIRKR